MPGRWKKGGRLATIYHHKNGASDIGLPLTGTAPQSGRLEVRYKGEDSSNIQGGWVKNRTVYSKVYNFCITMM